MKRSYVIAPQAARDLVQIWRYIKTEKSKEIADRVESVIRNKFGYLAEFPYAGHLRSDLTSADVRFLPVYSYLVVYRPDTEPVQIVGILHARRDVARIIEQRV